MPKGGKREGSGRPMRDNYKKLSITLSEETIELVKQYQEDTGEIYFSNALENLLREVVSEKIIL